MFYLQFTLKRNPLLIIVKFEVNIFKINFEIDIDFWQNRHETVSFLGAKIWNLKRVPSQRTCYFGNKRFSKIKFIENYLTEFSKEWLD